MDLMYLGFPAVLSSPWLQCGIARAPSGKNFLSITSDFHTMCMFILHLKTEKTWSSLKAVIERLEVLVITVVKC